VSAPDPDLTDPVTITFDNPPTTFTVSGATTGSPTAAVPYASGSPISFNGWTVDIVGTPSAGDSFTIVPNTNGVGDNRNALLLASLQTVDTMDSGGATYGEAYGRLVSRVGTLTQAAEINRGAQEVILSQAIDARESVSGVNLDEEAANLLRFQQAYQASAQVIAVAEEIFDSLLSAVN
jgi:flagellar hook-associated protein 1 FlgK